MSVAIPCNGTSGWVLCANLQALPRCGYPIVFFMLYDLGNGNTKDVCADAPAGHDLFMYVTCLHYSKNLFDGTPGWAVPRPRCPQYCRHFSFQCWFEDVLLRVYFDLVIS